MIQRIYIDTSIVGGFFDEEFKEVTGVLFNKLQKGDVIFVISDLLELELIDAPVNVREHLETYSVNSFEKITFSEEAEKLAQYYISENVVGKSSITDCRHIALATINRVDVLASWNFKHIVNLERIKGYNSINLRMGYPMIEIRSPLELINYED
jgi:hypothetical protein